MFSGLDLGSQKIRKFHLIGDSDDSFAIEWDRARSSYLDRWLCSPSVT